MKKLTLNTGLFPDAGTVAAALATLEGAQSVERADLTGLVPEDEEGWAAVARAVLAAELIVTL
jgi:hypothetical protein